MSHVCRIWLVCFLAAGGIAACKNDRVAQMDVPRAVGEGPKDRDAGSDEEADASSRDSDSVDEDAPRPRSRPQPTPRAGDDDNDSDEAEPDEPPDEPRGEAGSGGDDDGAGGDDERPDPDAPPVAGTADAAGCNSFTPAEDGMCGSFFCGVSEASLAAEVSSSAVCSNTEFFCSGNLVTVAGDCARRVKSGMPLASNESLRPAIRDCVYADAAIQENVSEDCLECYLVSFDCGGQVDTCLIECLNGNSAECDQCMRDNGCLDPVFTCSGLPSPF
jgi:hypothetical protein